MTYNGLEAGVWDGQSLGKVRWEWRGREGGILHDLHFQEAFNLNSWLLSVSSVMSDSLRPHGL